MPPHHGDSRLSRHPRPRTPLVEHHGDRLPRERLPHRGRVLRIAALERRLVGRRLAHERRELGGREVRRRREVARRRGAGLLGVGAGLGPEAGEGPLGELVRLVHGGEEGAGEKFPGRGIWRRELQAAGITVLSSLSLLAIRWYVSFERVSHSWGAQWREVGAREDEKSISCSRNESSALLES